MVLVFQIKQTPVLQVFTFIWRVKNVDSAPQVAKNVSLKKDFVLSVGSFMNLTWSTGLTSHVCPSVQMALFMIPLKTSAQYAILCASLARVRIQINACLAIKQQMDSNSTSKKTYLNVSLTAENP